jgi:hypothetical protein
VSRESLWGAHQRLWARLRKLHVIEAVKGLDSDGDGYENGDELEAGTFPGFASSYPNNPKKGLDIRIILAVLSVLVGALVVSKKALNKR